MKKRILSLLLVAIMACSICACGSSNESVQNNNLENSENQTIDKKILDEYEGAVAIKRKYFPELIECIELTAENWKDYIKLYSFEEENVTKDTFGEIVESETIKRYCIGAGNEKYHHFDEVALELKNKETGETIIYEFSYYGYYVDEKFKLEDYELTRIKGKLYFIDLPEEALVSPLIEPWGYELGFIVSGNGQHTPYEIDKASKAIHNNGSNTFGHYLD